MKLLPDDPRLSAYVLGELDAAEMVRVERAAAADPAIRISLNELERTAGMLTDLFGAESEARLRPTQRRAVMKASADSGSSGVSVELPRASWRPWILAVGAAAAVVLATVAIGRFGGSRPGGLVNAEEVSLLPAPGPESGGARVASGGAEGASLSKPADPVDQAGPFREIARTQERGKLPDRAKLPATGNLASPSSDAELRLPVVTGTGSAVWVRRWIMERGELPPRDAVRVEEMVNSVTLPMEPLGEELEFAVSAMPCPWDNTRTLVGVGFRAKSEDIADLELRSLSGQPRRIIGSYAVRSDAALSSVLPKGRSQLVLLEFSGNQELGSIEIRIGDSREFSRPVPSSTEPGPMMERAAAMAAFGLWLRDEGVSRDDLKAVLERTRAVDPTWQEQWLAIQSALALTEK